LRVNDSPPNFSFFHTNILLADGLEEMYEEAHAKIRENPNLPAEGEKKDAAYWKSESLKYRSKKLTREQRRANVQAKIKELAV
jgi:large subunit ribosomal protein L5e